MDDNPFSAAESEARPAWVAGPDGGLPNVMDLVSACIAEVQKDFVSWILAGLPPAMIAIAAALGSVVAIYGGMALGMMPGIMANDDDLALAGAIGGLALGFGLLIGVLGLVLAPMTAGMWRAVWRYLTVGEKLTFTSCFRYALQDLPRVLVFNLVFGLVVFAGSMLCYVPGLVAAVALGFAYPAVVVQGQPIGAAIASSVGHVRENPAWHLGLFAVTFVMALILPYLPVIGYALLFTLYPLFVLMAYRAAHGTDRPAFV